MKSESMNNESQSAVSSLKDPASISISNLREAFNQGEDIARLLNHPGLALSREDVIEVSYDLQAGTYSQIALDDPYLLKEYALQLYDLAKDYLEQSTVILDCGTGELTSLSALSQHLKSPTRLLACDISLSRLRKGRSFAKRFMKPELMQDLGLFMADMARIPLADNSVDLVLTVHSLEPNHGRELELLKELLRVARTHLVLFEPSWENASEAVRARMKQHGYIRNLPQYIERAGGRLVSINPLPRPLNTMNPTFCYVVEPLKRKNHEEYSRQDYCCPRSHQILQRKENFWWSHDGGWAYPEIDGIPCLRVKHGILMSHG